MEYEVPLRFVTGITLSNEVKDFTPWLQKQHDSQSGRITTVPMPTLPQELQQDNQQ